MSVKTLSCERQQQHSDGGDRKCELHCTKKTGPIHDRRPNALIVCIEEDLDALIDRVPADQRLVRRCSRLLKQAYDQGALLSNVDLSFMFGLTESRIATALASHERENNVVLPRRATLHDVGSGVTHKRIICIKRYVEGKTSDVIARETHHSITAVDRYLGMFDRVRMCRREGLGSLETARALNCTERLVNEYLRLDDELDAKEVACAQ